MTAIPRGQVLLYRFVRSVLAGFCRIYWRQTTEGREPLPDEPFVLPPVHRSDNDTQVV